MTGGFLAFGIVTYEHTTGHSLSAFVWLMFGGAVLSMGGAYRAWSEQFDKAMLAGNPEIVIEYDKQPAQATAPALIIKNLGGGNAYKVKIRDITNGSAVVVFNEISHFEEKQSFEATGTFNRFTVPTPHFKDNFAVFLRTVGGEPGAMQAIEHSLSPQAIKVIVDYFNVSDMRFTAEYEIRVTYGWEDTHAFPVRRQPS